MGFDLAVDRAARQWLDAHPSAEPRVIDYEVQRCCGGGKICQVRVRERSQRDDPDRFAAGSLDDGTSILIEKRAAARLPAHFGLTTRGRGSREHLDLSLESEQWGDLLYT
jgi:hypothetical protein